MNLKVNWSNMLNSVVLAVSIGIFAEIRSTHDAIIRLQMKVDGYDVQIADVRTRISAVEVEIQKLKERQR